MLASPTVTLVDHGAGNLRSVVRPLERLGARVELTADPERVRACDRLVVPGQGAFGDCMRRLREGGLGEAIAEHIRADRPYFGICLGLQILFERGVEHGVHAGLGVLRGEVRALPKREGIKIPHMGWNAVERPDDMSMLSAVPDGTYFYFVHSYYAQPDEDLVCAHTVHGIRFVSAVARGRLFACQFHPEKSQRAGLALLEAFLT